MMAFASYHDRADGLHFSASRPRAERPARIETTELGAPPEPQRRAQIDAGFLLWTLLSIDKPSLSATRLNRFVSALQPELSGPEPLLAS
jgi:hypothetical protein